jgi:hypothetical protein
MRVSGFCPALSLGWEKHGRKKRPHIPRGQFQGLLVTFFLPFQITNTRQQVKHKCLVTRVTLGLSKDETVETAINLHFKKKMNRL